MIRIRIDREGNPKLLINEKAAFVLCKHCIMKFSLDFIDNEPLDMSLRHEEITFDNLVDCIEMQTNIEKARDYLNNQTTIKGHIFYLGQDPVGLIWIGYRGTNEYEYKVRDTDAFGFDFVVNNRYRGQGIIERMIYEVLLELKKEGISEMLASVRKNNQAAIHAYEKIGAKVVDHKNWIRLVGRNIPYHRI